MSSQVNNTWSTDHNNTTFFSVNVWGWSKNGRHGRWSRSLTFALLGGGGGFHSRSTAFCISLPLARALRILSENVSPRSSQGSSPVQVKLPYLKNIRDFAEATFFGGEINLKHSGVGKGIVTYKTHLGISISVVWDQVNFVIWAIRTCSNIPGPEMSTSDMRNKGTSGNMLSISRFSYIRSLLMTHMHVWLNHHHFR